MTLLGGEIMHNNSLSSKLSQNIRGMNQYDNKLNLNEFVGMENSCMEDIEDMPIAMAYVPWQQWRQLYEPKEALRRGTLFKELDLPFECAKGCK